MNDFEREARALVKLDSFDDTCMNCSFYPGGGSWVCLAPWSDIQIEDERIEACFEGVYRYISGKPAHHLKRLLDKNADWVRLREKGKFVIEIKEATCE